MDDVPVADQYRALDDVLQLARIARPVIRRQHVDRRGGEPADVAAVLGRIALQEVVGEQQHVGLPLAQRRDEDREDVEAVEQVLAEAALLDRPLEILVGRGNQPDVGLQRLVAAEALELPLLQDAQQLDLRRQLHVANLVEEQRPSLGQFEPPLLAGVGAGERPLLVAEQLGFDQRIRQRAAADLHERLLGPRRVVVDRAGDQLLAGAGLAAQQHGRVGPRDLRDLLVDALHRAAVADDAGEVVALAQLLLEMGVLVDEALVLRRHQPLDLEGLADHRGDQAVERLGPFVVAVGLEPQVDAERADDAAVDANRDADEAELLPGRVAPSGAAQHQGGLPADPRHDHRLAGFDDRANDPFAERVMNVMGGTVQAVGGIDMQLAAVVVEADDQAVGDRMAPRQGLEHHLQGAARIERARQRVGNLQQRREALLLGGRPVGRGGPRRGLAGHRPALRRLTKLL